MPETSLYQVISNIQNNQSDKRMIGYTVDAYNGILESFKNYQSSNGYGDSVLGKYNKIDWEKITSSTFDDSGISNDQSSGLWRMVMTFHGAFPVKSIEYGCYDILSFPNDNEMRATTMDSFGSYCPYLLDKDRVSACSSEDFVVGACIDLSRLAVKYFNNFYSKGDFKFNEERVNKLFREGYIRAQIVFPSLKKYKEIKIIGHTAISDNACISISSPILGTREWSDIGVTMYVLENSKDAKEVAPNGIEYKFACAGESYNPDKGTINGFNRETFINNWLNNTSEKYVSSNKNLSLQQIPIQECYVRLYVPSKYRNDVLSMFGQNVPNEFLFQESFSMVFSKKEAAVYSGQASTIVSAAAYRWSSVMKGTVKGDVGTIYYSTSERPYTLQRNTTYHYESSQGDIIPTFGHNSNVYDCSSFVSMILWDSGIVRDDVQQVPAFNSYQLSSPTIVSEINKYIKPQYQAIIMDLTDESQVLSGDIIVLTREEKLQYHNETSSFGHAEMAFIDSVGKTAIAIGSNSKGPVKRTYKPYDYFKHIIRIVDKTT